MAFLIGVVSGGLIVLNVGTAAALGLGLCVLVAVAIVCHRVSGSSTSWSPPHSA